jgi:hypothetical protein
MKTISSQLGLPKRFWNNNELTTDELEVIKTDLLFGKYISGADFISALDNKFTPYMKTIGFKGRKNNFYKLNDKLLFTIGIFKGKYGGECSLAAGVHIAGFPTPGLDKLLESNKFTTSHCMLHKTLELKNGNANLRYGKTIEDGNETVGLMIDIVTQDGMNFFEKFSLFPSPFNKIKFDDILNPNNKFIEFGISDNMLNWVHFHKFLARFNHHFGDNELALKILKKTRDDEYNTDRLTQKGISPLLSEIDKMIKEFS